MIDQCAIDIYIIVSDNDVSYILHHSSPSMLRSYLFASLVHLHFRLICDVLTRRLDQCRFGIDEQLRFDVEFNRHRRELLLLSLQQQIHRLRLMIDARR